MSFLFFAKRFVLSFVSFFWGAYTLNAITIYDTYCLERNLSRWYPLFFTPEGIGYKPQELHALRRAAREGVLGTNDNPLDIRGPAVYPMSQKCYEAFANNSKLSPKAQEYLLDHSLTSKNPSMLEWVAIEFLIAAQLSDITLGDLSATDLQEKHTLYDAQRGRRYVTQEGAKRCLKGLFLDDSHALRQYPHYAQNYRLACHIAIQEGLIPLYLPCPGKSTLGIGDLVASFLRNEFPLPCPEGNAWADGYELSPLGFLSHDASHAEMYVRNSDVRLRYELAQHPYDQECYTRDTQRYAYVFRVLQDFYVYLLEGLMGKQGEWNNKESLKAMAQLFLIIHEHARLPLWWQERSLESILLEWVNNNAKNPHESLLSSYAPWEPEGEEWLYRMWDGLRKEDEPKWVDSTSRIWGLGPVRSYVVKAKADFIQLKITFENGETKVSSKPLAGYLLKKVEDDLALLNAVGIFLEKPDMEPLSLDKVRAFCRFINETLESCGRELSMACERRLQVFFLDMKLAGKDLNAEFAQLCAPRKAPL